MLSFLRDPNTGDLPADKAVGNAQKIPNAKTREQEYFTVASHGRAVRKSTTILAVLFIIGVICLWFMIKKSAPQTASANEAVPEETQIETAIARLTGIRSEMFTSMDEIVSKFYEFSDVLQVKVEELSKNPFQFEMFLSNLKDKAPTEEEPVGIDPELIWQQQIRQKSKQMKLDSIMQSDMGKCCMINNKILYAGNSIDGFKVLEIDDTQVKLGSGGVEIVLTLSK
jgi:preprotein translocase subunit SecG